MKRKGLYIFLLFALLLGNVFAISIQTKADSKNWSVEYNIVSSWEKVGEYYSLINAKVVNNSTVQVEDWNTVIPFAKDGSIVEFWNSSCVIKNNTIVVNSLDYNKIVYPGAQTEFGLIVKTKTKFELQGNSQSQTSNQGQTDGNTNTDKTDTSNTSNISETTTTTTDDKSEDSGKTTDTQNIKDTTEETDSKETNSKEDSKETDTKKTESTDKTTNTTKTTTTTTASKKKDWLYAKGNKIVDGNNKQVWITGINWFGYNTGTNTFDGLWSVNLDKTVAEIANRGFNLIRVPFSVEIIKNWSNGKYPKANYNQSVNTKLKGKNSLQIFDYFLKCCEKNGLKVMIDIHSAKSDPMGHMTPLWYDQGITVKDYYNALAWMAKRYKSNDTIIAYDLKNEPHGTINDSTFAIWNNSKSKNNWKYIAETAASKILAKNPNVLIIVEGVEIYPKDIKKNKNYTSKDPSDYYYNWWGGNLRGVKDYPVDLGKYQNKLVYSPHDYGPAVYQQPWFYKGYNYKSLYKDVWKDNWMFIYEDKTAPLFIGEWGGFMSEPNLTWMKHMRTLITKYKLHHTFWCLNANSGDTGGLLKDDFSTWDEEKYKFVKKALWQKNGKFVGLDGQIPLGKNGTTR